MKKLLGIALLFTALAVAASGASAQTLSASPSSLFAGQSSTATWSGIATPTTTDWIGLYIPGSGDNAFVSWQYTDGSGAGSAPFLIPVGTAAGTYELRLYATNSFTLLAASSSFTVNTPPPATIDASPSSLLAGQSTTATWTNIIAPSATDWIGLFTPGSANNAFISWRYTDGTAASNVPFQIPYGTSAGTYELRLFSNDTLTLLATSSSVTVTASPPITLSVSPSSVLQGNPVTASWANITAPSATDWVGLYLPGAADNAFVSWRYTDGTATSSVPFNIDATVANGTYQLRLFSNDGFTRLATSNNFAVGVVALHYIEVDHLNTPRAIYDASQNLEWKWDQQEPFGVTGPDENPSGLGAFEFPVRFPGQYQDKETNLAYNWMRDYDPVTGRYAKSDPIGLLGGINPYAYANAPLTEIDPQGLTGRASGAVGSHTPMVPTVPTTPAYVEALQAASIILPVLPFPGIVGNTSCGSYGFQFPNVLDGAMIEGACANHDTCYETCGVWKDDCDKRFRDDIRRSCGGGVRCVVGAQIYFGAVQRYGEKAFMDAREHCRHGQCNR